MSHHTDVPAKRLLTDLPAFERWEQRPLNRQLKMMLANLDEQTLLSLTAHAVNQVAHGPAPARYYPI